MSVGQRIAAALSNLVSLITKSRVSPTFLRYFRKNWAASILEEAGM